MVLLCVRADFGCESQDDDWERKRIAKEDEDIRDFAKCHPLPSPDDEEGEKVWQKVIESMKEAEEVNGMMMYSFVRIEIMKKVYENVTDKKKNIMDCGKKLNGDGESNAMIIS